MYDERKYKRDDYRANKEKYKERIERQRQDKGFCAYYDRIKKYKLSVIQYLYLFKFQDFKCAICQTLEPNGKGGWHIDHNHTTGKVRGLLCHHCNTAIGSLQDSTRLLQRATDYLICNNANSRSNFSC